MARPQNEQATDQYNKIRVVIFLKENSKRSDWILSPW